LWWLRRHDLDKLYWRLRRYVVDLHDRRHGLDIWRRLDYADHHGCCYAQQRFGRDGDQR
jgi:hypothetical protein